MKISETMVKISKVMTTTMGQVEILLLVHIEVILIHSTQIQTSTAEVMVTIEVNRITTGVDVVNLN